MTHSRRIFPTLLALVAILANMLSCAFGQTETQITVFDQYYLIEPISLLESLKQGDMSAFTPVKERPELFSIDQQVVVNWQQADYFYIAHTLYEGVVGNTLRGWQLNSMDFQLSCKEMSNGFQNGRFDFFKVIKEKEDEFRISRFIDIDPRENFIHVKEKKYYPHLARLEVIDFAKLKVSADLALRIIELNRGADIRDSVENNCDISIILSPSPANDGQYWVVTYSRNDDHTLLLYVRIDPYTGKINSP
jgi:hypothetical protein